MTTDDACRAARHTLVQLRSRIDEDTTLLLTIEGMIAVEREHFLDEATYVAAAHIEACAACQGRVASWLDEQFPERVAHRERLQKYCCGHMFDAVVNPDAEVRFSFEMFRGEDPSWCINGDYSFARFCPWCGHDLPNQAFEPERSA